MFCTWLVLVACMVLKIQECFVMYVAGGHGSMGNVEESVLYFAMYACRCQLLTSDVCLSHFLYFYFYVSDSYCFHVMLH